MSKIHYDFGSGRSDPSTFPVAGLQAAATKVIAEQAQELTEYPGNLGHPGMRKAMALRESEREGVSVDPDHLMLTNGSMQGVTLSAEALQENHGDTILVEEYSYPGTLSAYRNLKLDMVGIPLDEGGMRPDKVEEQLERLSKEKRLPKFIYTISTYQTLPALSCRPRDDGKLSSWANATTCRLSRITATPTFITTDLWNRRFMR